MTVAYEAVFLYYQPDSFIQQTEQKAVTEVVFKSSSKISPAQAFKLVDKLTEKPESITYRLGL